MAPSKKITRSKCKSSKNKSKPHVEEKTATKKIHRSDDQQNFFRILQIFSDLHPIALHKMFERCNKDFCRTIDNILFVKRYCYFLNSVRKLNSNNNGTQTVQSDVNLNSFASVSTQTNAAQHNTDQNNFSSTSYIAVPEMPFQNNEHQNNFSALNTSENNTQIYNSKNYADTYHANNFYSNTPDLYTNYNHTYSTLNDSNSTMFENVTDPFVNSQIHNNSNSAEMFTSNGFMHCQPNNSYNDSYTSFHHSDPFNDFLGNSQTPFSPDYYNMMNYNYGMN